MLTLAKTFEWDMGHRIANHDSLCRNLHGHRYKLIVYISGPIVNQANSAQEGMILDFSLLKQLVNDVVIDDLDHSFMFWEKDKVMSTFAKQNNGLKLHQVPFVPTAECIVRHVADILSKAVDEKLPGIVIVSLELFETPTSKAVWTREEAV